MDSWFSSYLEWVAENKCSVYTVTSSEVKPISKDKFYPCLKQFLRNDKGAKYFKEIVFRENETVKGWRQTAQPIRFEALAKDGPQYLEDIRSI